MKRTVINRKTLAITEVVNHETGEITWIVTNRYLGAGGRVLSQSEEVYASNPQDEWLAAACRASRCRERKSG